MGTGKLQVARKLGRGGNASPFMRGCLVVVREGHVPGSPRLHPATNQSSCPQRPGNKAGKARAQGQSFIENRTRCCTRQGR